MKNYPHVQGMAKDVFFLTHDHKENGGEDDFVSKYNQFEVCVLNVLDVDVTLRLLVTGRHGQGSGSLPPSVRISLYFGHHLC